MSVDYEIYLSDDISQDLLLDFRFIEESRSNGIVRGSAFDGVLLFFIAKGELSDSFIREEVGFDPKVKLILSPDLDRYDESLNAIIKVINACVAFCEVIKFYQNNEILLLEKGEKSVTLYTNETSWWDDYLKSLEFDFNKQ
jgi:hypothetical protein